MLLGIIEAIWQGTPLPLKPGSTFNLGGLSSKPQPVGQNIDFSNSMEPSDIKLKVAIQRGFSVTGTFPRGAPGELQIQCDSGQIFTWENAFVSGTINITTGDSSEAEVSFATGTPLEQVQQ